MTCPSPDIHILSGRVLLLISIFHIDNTCPAPDVHSAVQFWQSRLTLTFKEDHRHHRYHRPSKTNTELTG